MKSWASKKIACRYHYPVESCGIHVDIDGTGRGVNWTRLPGVHEFSGRSAFHMHVLRFPYALQPDATLRETLETQGWMTTGKGLSQYPGGKIEFVLADGTRKYVTLSVLLLWLQLLLLPRYRKE